MRLTVITFTLLLTVSCVSFAIAETPQEKLKIGALLTLSGNFASAGEDSRRGIEAGLAVSEAQSRLEFIFADSKNEPHHSISEFQKLVNVDNVLAVYTHRSSIGMALSPISLRSAVPLLGAVGHKDFASGNSFAIQVWPRSDDEGGFVAEEFIRRGEMRAALIYTEDEWTSSVSDGFRERFLALGGTLVFDEPVLPAETDFRTQLLKIKSAAPDAIYMNVLLPQIVPMAQQIRGLQISSEIFSNFYVAKEDVLEAAGAATLEGVKYVEIDTNLPALKAQLQQSADTALPGLTVASYVATLLLAQTALDNSDIRSAKDLQTALLQQSEVKTPDRVYPIENRYIKFPLVVKIISDGKVHAEK